ncbi:ABC transporter ATP-binding protein [Olsenella uli]|uniref:ABC transporter ATP-binding protein n=1 Tax=Olsenella uli TaxID=133926 RepID=UPI0028D1F030|nr:ABC transporter ATP-binding protein [Olsenella uli]
MLGLVHRILVFSGPHARRIRIAYLFTFLRAFCATMPLMLSIVALNLLLEGRAMPLTCCLLAAGMLALLTLQSLFQYLSDRLQSGTGYEVFADKRLELGAHLRRLPMGFFTEGNIGRISSILSADMVFIEEQSMAIIANVVSDVFSQAILTICLFVMDPLIGAAVLITELLVILIAQPMLRQEFRNSDARQQTIEQLTGAVVEYIEGLAVVKSYNLTGEGARDLRESFAATRRTSLQFVNEQSPYEAAQLVLYGLGSVAVLALAIGQMEQGLMTPGTFAGVALFLFQLFGPLKNLYSQSSLLSIMKSALDRIDALFAQEELEDIGTDALPAFAAHEIEFSHVSFAYGEKNVLQDVSLTADRGQMVALVGQSGSGKTTLVNLLARFWDVSGGQVLLRGTDVRALPLAALTDQISVVFQNVYLFQDTVFNNIAMGRPGATREEVMEAAQKARCYEFIMRLPYGFDTMVGEGGASLSGGEAQRVSLARAILKDAPIIILDEATASIDADNERFIQQAMTELCSGKTTLVIAHKLATIRNADKIAVIGDGRVLECGSHEELMALKGAYRHMVQANGEALGWNVPAAGTVREQEALRSTSAASERKTALSDVGDPDRKVSL